jgi:hypothetical protein
MSDCNHKNEQHLADSDSTSSGCIYWCSECGAISITIYPTERDWKIPQNLQEGREDIFTEQCKE